MFAFEKLYSGTYSTSSSRSNLGSSSFISAK
jgi:hypothetical protein